MAALAVLLMTGPVAAQESSNFKMTEHVFNAGGHPADGWVMSSSNYQITLDSVGEPLVGAGLESSSALAGASFQIDGGFAAIFWPPGEVTGLGFVDDETLSWSPEKSIGSYNLYRDLLSALRSLGYGSCQQYGLDDEQATDRETPPTEDGFFYLITAKNRLDEEGTKGRDSEGSERPNPRPCP
jgi:hypothetical protein